MRSAATRSRCGCRTPGRSSSTSDSGSGSRDGAGATTPTTARTRSSCGATPSEPRTSPPSGSEHGVILGIETSCDETAAAVVDDDGNVRSSVVASQADLHARYGGVVPEVASRRHLELVVPVVSAALEDAGATLDDVRRVAVTQGPGLIGALLVGLAAAK